MFAAREQTNYAYHGGKAVAARLLIYEDIEQKQKSLFQAFFMLGKNIFCMRLLSQTAPTHKDNSRLQLTNDRNEETLGE